jgi:hypothetical protein
VKPLPQADSRDPCPRCGVRGDVGCDHQAPCAPLVDNFVPPTDGRKERDYSGNGHNFKRKRTGR